MSRNLAFFNSIAFFLQIIVHHTDVQVFSFFMKVLFLLLTVAIIMALLRKRENLTKYEQFSLAGFLILDVAYLLVSYGGQM